MPRPGEPGRRPAARHAVTGGRRRGRPAEARSPPASIAPPPDGAGTGAVSAVGGRTTSEGRGTARPSGRRPSAISSSLSLGDRAGICRPGRLAAARSGRSWTASVAVRPPRTGSCPVAGPVTGAGRGRIRLSNGGRVPVGRRSVGWRAPGRVRGRRWRPAGASTPGWRSGRRGLVGLVGPRVGAAVGAVPGRVRRPERSAPTRPRTPIRISAPARNQPTGGSARPRSLGEQPPAGERRGRAARRRTRRDRCGEPSPGHLQVAGVDVDVEAQRCRRRRRPRRGRWTRRSAPSSPPERWPKMVASPALTSATVGDVDVRRHDDCRRDRS